MLPVFVVSDDKAVTLLIGAAVLFCPKFPDVTWKLVISDTVCIADGPAVTLLFGNADAEAEALVVEVVYEDPFTVVIWVIIRVIWRIRNDECILILRKACGKRDEKGFAQLATEEIKQIAIRWKVSLSVIWQPIALFLLLFVALN